MTFSVDDASIKWLESCPICTWNQKIKWNQKIPSHSSDFIILLQPFSPGLSSNPVAKEAWGVILSETPLRILWALLGLLWKSTVGKLAASLGSSYGKYISQHSWQTNLFKGDSQEAQDWPSNNEFSIFHSPQSTIFFLPCSYLLLFNIYASYKRAEHWRVSQKGQCNNNTFSQGLEKDLQVKSNGRGIQGERRAGRWMDSWSCPESGTLSRHCHILLDESSSTLQWITGGNSLTSPCLWLFHTCFVNRSRNSDPELRHAP